MQTIKINFGSSEWHEARALRYALFFEKHGLSKSVLDDEIDENSFHYGVKKEGVLVAYGRLTASENQIFKISQMVVDLKCQGSGYGAILLKRMIHEAALQNAGAIELNARLTAVDFYARHGFLKEGDVFDSKLTGIPHVSMKKLLAK